MTIEKGQVLYTIDVDSSKMKLSSVGDIVDKLREMGMGLVSHSLTLDQMNGKLNSIFGDNWQILNEEVLWKNLTIEEKIEKISFEIQKICSGNNLIITDPYIFCKNTNIKRHEEYSKLVNGIFNKLNCKKIKVITDFKNCNKDFVKLVKSQATNIDIEICYTTDFHDRFWLCSETKKGFNIGTSLNGVGNKICCMTTLEEDDVVELLNYIQNNIT